MEAELRACSPVGKFDRRKPQAAIRDVPLCRINIVLYVLI
jgi:hypothetical protein